MEFALLFAVVLFAGKPVTLALAVLMVIYGPGIAERLVNRAMGQGKVSKKSRRARRLDQEVLEFKADRARHPEIYAVMEQAWRDDPSLKPRAAIESERRSRNCLVAPPETHVQFAVASKS